MTTTIGCRQAQGYGACYSIDHLLTIRLRGRKGAVVVPGVRVLSYMFLKVLYHTGVCCRRTGPDRCRYPLTPPDFFLPNVRPLAPTQHTNEVCFLRALNLPDRGRGIAGCVSTAVSLIK